MITLKLKGYTKNTRDKHKVAVIRCPYCSSMMVDSVAELYGEVRTKMPTCRNSNCQRKQPMLMHFREELRTRIKYHLLEIGRRL